MSYSDDDYDEQYEEYYREYEEEEVPYVVGGLPRDDVDGFYLPAYDEVIWQKYTSFVGQMFSGKNFKESFQYFMEYYSLKKEIMDFLSFRDYCYLEIHKLFKYP